MNEFAEHNVNTLSADIKPKHNPVIKMKNGHAVSKLKEILFITSYPPRECGIANYSHDLIKSLNNKFSRSFKIRICPLESDNEIHNYSEDIKYILNTDIDRAFTDLSKSINDNDDIQMVMIQHEFGFFEKREDEFRQFLELLSKPVIVVFHTVLPHPDELLKLKVQQISDASDYIIVMTNTSGKILINDYKLPHEKITVIPHGTHLVPHSEKKLLKEKYNFRDKIVLSTFGLLSSGKSIETTLKAMPAIIKVNPDVLFIVLGKTHPSVLKREGEKYREMLQTIVEDLKIEKHVKFVNHFIPLPDLLEYLQLTDIYLFTSRDPNQAVSGTFSYAISCGCPIISTPIPHAREVLRNDAGIIIDFGNSQQLSDSVISLIKDEQLRKNISLNGLHRMASTAWENSAIAHAGLFEKIAKAKISLKYNLPPVNLYHFKKLTTDFGMIQFSKINVPDIDTGYTLDDNARALIAMCQHFERTKDEEDLKYIIIYLNFIKHCQQPDGNFLNYVDEKMNFTEQNNSVNLEDSNGRAVWALGYLTSVSCLFSGEYESIGNDADEILKNALLSLDKIHSTRAMAFVIKGLYYHNLKFKSVRDIFLIREFSNRLLQMHKHESDNEWNWFESYLTYANSILPEAMLCAWLATGETEYMEIARSSFDFLLSKTFSGNNINVITNVNWLHKVEKSVSEFKGGEQPIDVAYTILALSKFYDVFKNADYKIKMESSFNWFLGCNHISQIIYNPCTGGCYDGLEESHVNLNQGAESTVSYLMARLTVESTHRNEQKNNYSEKHFIKSEIPKKNHVRFASMQVTGKCSGSDITMQNDLKEKQFK